MTAFMCGLNVGVAMFCAATRRTVLATLAAATAGLNALVWLA